MRPNIPEQTGIQLDQGRASTDDFITRTYVLPLLADPATRARLIEEHRNNPVGRPGDGGKAGVGHSPDLITVIDKLRRAPMTGKYVRVCTRPHREYRIGIASGVRGEPVRMLEDEAYPSEDACEHAIFLKRVDDLLALYGHGR
jgi:branched-chain amino acid transport system permease protein